MPRKKKTVNKFTVVRDTREKEAFGYWFPEDDLCAGTVESGLKTGDYSILGHEDTVCVERKRNTAELAGNITEPRFWRELERMQSFRFRFVVFEFEMEDLRIFPINSGIPKDRWKDLRITPKFLMRKWLDIQMMNIPVVFLGDKGRCEKFVGYVLRRAWEEIQKGGSE